MKIAKRPRTIYSAFWAIFLTLATVACQPPKSSLEPVAHPHSGDYYSINNDYYHPARDLGPLFHDVQMQQLFDDGKTFVDMVAKRNPQEILADYLSVKEHADFQLAKFVDRNFLPPVATAVSPAAAISGSQTITDTQTMLEHIETLWPQLTRAADVRDNFYSSLLPLPHPYVVPGGRFREIYYWDSYFTMQGLVLSDQKHLARDMVRNFAWLIDTVGHIPNGNRSYYLSRSQPPFFAAMVALLRERGLARPGEFLPHLQAEYAFWMRGVDEVQPGQADLRVVKMPDGSVLNRYFDNLATPRPESYREDISTATHSDAQNQEKIFRNLRAAAESGWDFSSRWLADGRTLATIRTTEIVPVDLNSLLYNLELEISRQFTAMDNTAMANRYADKAQQRAQAVNRWLWNSKRKRYGDYLFETRRFAETDSLAMVYPLYFSLASADQAEAIAELLQRDFLKAGGLVTTLAETGQQWDAPNGWAPLQWLAVNGLRNYGFTELGEDIARRWLALNQKVYRNTGRMMEKYNVVDTTLAAGGGEYPTQDGFGWTNGVAAALGRMYPRARMSPAEPAAAGAAGVAR